MRFSRSFMGYSPAEVDDEKYRLLDMFNMEKKALTMELHEVVREHEQLVLQRNSLKSNLEAVSVSMSLMGKYEKHFSGSILSKVQRDGNARIEEIVKERESFITKMDEINDQLENELGIVQAKVLSVASSVEEVTQSIDITEFQFVGDQLDSIDAAIKDFIELASEFEPFSAFDTADVSSAAVPMLLAHDSLEFNREAEVSSPSSYVASSRRQEPTPPPKPSLLNPQADSVSSRAEGAAYIASITGGAFGQTRVDPSPSESNRQAELPTVLVAENDRETAFLLSNIVEREGFEVVMAADGYAVANMIKEMDPPAVVLLDTLLPYVDVTQLIKEIRANQRWRHVPILVLTSEHSKQSIIRSLNAGANDSLEKPFNPRELAARIKRLSSSAGQVQRTGSGM